MNKNKNMENRITKLFGIKYPIISGGMVWCSGWRLAAAVSNAGGLGLIGAGSMYPEVLREHIQKCKAATDKPFGVNVPLMYPDIEAIMDIIISEGVKVVFTSAGNPKTWTKKLQENGIKVAHVISSSKFALKCQEAGVDAVVAEGFEAGGHNGREETTTMTLIPQVRQNLELPLIAAGGIATGNGMLAAFALGAEGVQMGTRFALTQESSAAEEFKSLCITLNEGDTILSLKKLSPTRLIKNHFYEQVKEAEDRGASPEEMRELLGRGRSKKGIFEGDLKEGELEIGQIASHIKKLSPVEEVVKSIIDEFNHSAKALSGLSF
jgi:Dioxygenases related to 2-nitropropane dioxygenase